MYEIYIYPIKILPLTIQFYYYNFENSNKNFNEQIK